MTMINFQDCLYFSSARFNRVIGKISDTRFKQYGLSTTAAFILMALNETDVLNPTQIADQLSLDRSTITRFLDKLERDGYLQRSQQGRSINVTLTAKGKGLQPDLAREWSILNDEYIQQLGPKVEALLRETLNDAFEAYSKD